MIAVKPNLPFYCPQEHETFNLHGNAVSFVYFMYAKRKTFPRNKTGKKRDTF